MLPRATCKKGRTCRACPHEHACAGGLLCASTHSHYGSAAGKVPAGQAVGSLQFMGAAPAASGWLQLPELQGLQATAAADACGTARPSGQVLLTYVGHIWPTAGAAW